MALFFRVFASLILLILSSSVFSAGAGGGDTVTKWYQTSRAGVMICETNLSTACTARYGGSPNEISMTCDATYFHGVYRNAAGGETAVGDYHDIATNSKICTAPLVFSLNKQTCAATCIVPPDPCLAKKDQEMELEELCGLSVCPAGANFDTEFRVCKNAAGAVVPAQSVYDIPSPGKVNSFQGCEVVSLSSPDAMAGGYYKLADLGDSDLPTYCPIKYKFTGNKGNDSTAEAGGPPSAVEPTTATSPQVANLPHLPPNMYYPPAGGSCNAGDAGGTYGAGDSTQAVCVKGSGNNGNDGGTGGLTCLDGSPRPATGSCPTTDNGGGDNPSPTSCPNGAPKNADGTCPTSTGTGGSGTCTSSSCSATTTAECKTAPTCTGEPINCAILLQSWKNACLLIAPSTSQERQDVTNAMTQTDSSLTDIKTTLNSSIDNALSSLPTVSTSVSCIADSHFVIVGVTIPIPLSKLCPYFQTMRSMLLLVSYLFAARIIFGAIGSGGVRV